MYYNLSQRYENFLLWAWQCPVIPDPRLWWRNLPQCDSGPSHPAMILALLILAVRLVKLYQPSEVVAVSFRWTPSLLRSCPKTWSWQVDTWNLYFDRFLSGWRGPRIVVLKSEMTHHRLYGRFFPICLLPRFSNLKNALWRDEHWQHRKSSLHLGDPRMMDSCDLDVPTLNTSWSILFLQKQFCPTCLNSKFMIWILKVIISCQVYYTVTS